MRTPMTSSVTPHGHWALALRTTPAPAERIGTADIPVVSQLGVKLHAIVQGRRSRGRVFAYKI